MKLLRLALVLVLVPGLGLVACAEQAGEEGAETMEMAMAVDMEALGEAIADITAQWDAAYEAGDAASLAALYTEDAFRMPPFEATERGREAVEQAYAEMFAATSEREITINPIEYGGSGNLSFTVGTYSYSYLMEGETFTDEGKYLVVSKMADDGTWKILAHSWSSNLPDEE